MAQRHFLILCIHWVITVLHMFSVNFAVGTDFGQDAIECAAVFLFKTFHNKEQVGHEETRAIKQMFGPFPASAADTACAAVSQLVAQLGESRVEVLIQTQTSNKPVDHGMCFGRNIAFSFDTYVLDSLDSLPWEEENGEGPSLDFNSFLSSHATGRGSGFESAGTQSVSQSSSADRSILRREVEKYLSGGNMGSSSVEELCTSLFEMLASTKSDDELQNEVRGSVYFFVLTLASENPAMHRAQLPPKHMPIYCFFKKNKNTIGVLL